MKKAIKITGILLILIISLSSLSGCKELDSLRNSHAKWLNQGYTDMMELNGVRYKKIPYDDPAPCLNAKYTSSGTVTSKEVPVLTLLYRDSNLLISDDKYFINYEDYGATFFSSGELYYAQSYYCREDIYDSVIYEIENGLK